MINSELAMELRHLRYFVAVAKHEHITNAAKSLGIQQPPLTHQIKLLEKELGVKLFTRQSRRIKLTSAGKLFLSEANLILNQVDSAVLRVKRHALGEEGNLIIGFTSSAALHFATPNIIKQFREQFPLINITIQEGAAHDLLHDLEEEKVDIVFTRLASNSYQGIDFFEISKEDMVLALPIGHPILDRPNKKIQLKDLKNEPFIFYQQINGSGIKEKLIADFNKAGFEPNVVETVYRIISALQLVASGIGISIVPKSMNVIQNKIVEYRDFHPENQMTVPLNIAFRKNTQKLPIVNFITLANELSLTSI